MTSPTLAALLLAACPPQDSYLNVPSSLMNEIGQVLPERSNAGAGFVTDTYSPNIIVSAPATLQVVFLWEGAGYRNSLGYFTYEELPDGSVTILDSDLLIADASFPSAGNAQTGDVYDLRAPDGTPRVFQSGERVGFFVVADGWNREPRIRNWSSETTGIPSTDFAENATTGRGCYTTLNSLNPERATGAVDASRHVAMLWFPPVPGFLGDTPFLVTGFEDLDRRTNSDDDFNDLVFLVTGTPIESIETTQAFNYEPGDPDNDGVSGTADHFPDDPERAFVTRWPASGVTAYSLEDQYPGLGDADFNDAVIGTSFEIVSNADGDVKDVMVTGHLVARGAGYDHAVGLHLPGIPLETTGVLEIERVLSGDEPMTLPVESRALSSVIQEGRRFDLFESTRNALPPIAGATFTNTQFEGIDRPAASARARLTFDQAIDPVQLGPPPFDIYFAVLHGEERWDVHLPGVQGFADRPAHLPVESGELAFVREGRPWMIEVPTSWRFPREQVRIWEAYPRYNEWANSGGTLRRDWYRHPSSSPSRLGLEFADYVPNREWSLLLR